MRILRLLCTNMSACTVRYLPGDLYAAIHDKRSFIDFPTFQRSSPNRPFVWFPSAGTYREPYTGLSVARSSRARHWCLSWTVGGECARPTSTARHMETCASTSRWVLKTSIGYVMELYMSRSIHVTESSTLPQVVVNVIPGSHMSTM